ncbi:hypothetical protein L5515_003133 [Caenorhabditis briggsae]|nr:hypothetical protein L5515_003133 [Caenorhabditis briggsae]
MFNTFEAERSTDPPIYGLITNENSFNQIYLQFHTLWDLLLLKGFMKDKKGEPLFPGMVNKIKAIIYPPGWFPGVPVTPFFHWMSMVDPAHKVPEPSKPVVKYSPPARIIVKVYVAVSFILLLAIFFHFEYDRINLSYLECSVKIAYFVVTMQCFGAFFDMKWYARYIEIARCCGVLGYYAFLMFDHIGAGTHRLFVISLHIMAILLWTTDILIEKFSKCCCHKNNQSIAPEKSIVKKSIDDRDLERANNEIKTISKCVE